MPEVPALLRSMCGVDSKEVEEAAEQGDPTGATDAETMASRLRRLKAAPAEENDDGEEDRHCREPYFIVEVESRESSV